MSIDRFIDERIGRAIAEGEFDNLPGKGKPLDLDWYFDLPEDFRLAYSILKNAGCAPEETQLFSEIASLKKRIHSCDEDQQRAEMKKEIAEKTLSLNLLIERRRRK